VVWYENFNDSFRPEEKSPEGPGMERESQTIG